MQTRDDFPSKRREELASLRPDIEITVSWGGSGFPNLDTGGIDNVKRPLFDPLRPWLAKKILRIRERSGLLGVSDDVRRSSIMDFWTLRRKQRSSMAHVANRNSEAPKGGQLLDEPAQSSLEGEDDEPHDREDVIDEVETEVDSDTPSGE